MCTLYVPLRGRRGGGKEGRELGRLIGEGRREAESKREIPERGGVIPCTHTHTHSGSDEPIDLELPNQWLWDIVDEFIYQVRTHPFTLASHTRNNCTKIPFPILKSPFPCHTVPVICPVP